MRDDEGKAGTSSGGFDVQPVAGRSFTADEDTAGCRAPVLITQSMHDRHFCRAVAGSCQGASRVSTGR